MIRDLCRRRWKLVYRKFGGGEPLTQAEAAELAELERQIDEYEAAELAPDLAKLEEIVQEHEKLAKKVGEAVKWVESRVNP